MFLEGGYETPELQQQEDEANTFSRDFLIPPKEWKAFTEASIRTKVGVREFAKSLNIKTSIVVGRLMFEQYIGYGHPLRSEIDKYEFK